ncbi:LITAF domain-containing protein [Caenorhabditis elegans]|uniref:LITAF domain-containing protein n=1 Tax=Caenorhabditis elegans TaxID=6239 RepID=Q7YX23_CAEEL|nr:LITAF domain-containing protein [Caenorhabditis elegans]CAE17809.2 LITAF domain-containing protein [Caenorhabditis elegans]|eukprot:NP_001335508.1 Uncharacterized protein CELE_F15G9.6 [Caenorhabditis elegans]
MYKYEDSTEINCPKCFQKLAEKLTEMADLTKLVRTLSPEISGSTTISSLATTTTSSVSPNCDYVTQKKYIRNRRLVTRTDVRSRMSVWVRLFAWCRGGNKAQEENGTIFTMRS